MCTCIGGFFDLIAIEQSACAYEHLGALLGDLADRLLRRRRPKSDLDNSETCGKEGLGKIDCTCSVVDNHHGNESAFEKAVREVNAHGKLD